MLTKVLAQELHKFNISVNELIPGPVVTDMGNSSMKDSNSAFSVDGEWIKGPEDVTNIALFMASQPLIGPTGQSFSLMRRDL
jgi:3-oxoacyl-[acyl-carrier protein] reductase